MTLAQSLDFYEKQANAAAYMDSVLQRMTGSIQGMTDALDRAVGRMNDLLTSVQKTASVSAGLKTPFDNVANNLARTVSTTSDLSNMLSPKNFMLGLTIGVGWQLFGDDILTLLSPAMAALESFAGVVHNLVGGLVPAFAPVVQGLAAAMGIYAAATVVSTAVTWLQVEANQKLLASMLLNPILWVALAIGAVVAAMFRWGAVAESVGTVIGYVFGVAYNLFALLANCVLGFADLVGKVIGGTVLGLLSGALFLVEKLVAAFDAIRGTNFAAGIGGFRDSIGKLQEGLRSSPLKLETVDPAGMAKKWGQATLNFTQGANTKLGYGSAADLSGFDTVTRNQAAMEQVYGGYGQKNLLDVNSVNTVKNVNGTVNMADEDMQFIKDAAEMRFIQNFVTLTPTVAMNANISGITDVDAMMTAMGKRLEEMMVVSAEGVHP